MKEEQSERSLFMYMRRAIRVSLLIALPILCLGCPPTVPRQAIVGTWQTGIKDKISTQTFSENGMWSFQVGKKKQTGTYKFIADNQIEIQVDVPSEAKPIVYKRKINFSYHDLLNTTEEETGQWKRWKRVEPK
jgi:hypothetical protein